MIFGDPKKGSVASYLLVVIVGWVPLNSLLSRSFGDVGKINLRGRYGTGKFAVFFPIKDNVFSLLLCCAWVYFLFSLVE